MFQKPTFRSSLGYTRYDGVSRLATSSQWIAGGTDIFSDGFESGDLSAWALSDIPANEYSEQIFDYDIAGNLTKITTDGTPQIHAISATTNRLTGNGFSYDSAGNLTQFPGDDGVPVQHQYDAFNRLSKRTHGNHVTRYFYTADDERIMRFGTEGFSWTLRDFGGQLLREFKPDVSAGMVPERDHIYRGGSLIGIVTPNASGQLTVKHHYSLDHLGSPRLITDAAGQAEARHKYYPFGEEATLSSQNRHPMKFTGHERDFNEAGEGDDLDYMHARLCDPRKGRFLSVDPVRGSPGSPQSWNGYAYVRGNPMMYTDPTGEISRREGASLVVSFIPVIGDVKDVQEVVTGVDLISGEKLSTTERVVTVAAALVPIVSGVLLRKGLQAATKGTAVVDANTLIRGIEAGEAAGVDAALAGRAPLVPITAAKEFLSKGDVGALRSFLSSRGGRIAAAGSEESAGLLRTQADGLGRSLKVNDSRVAASALREGVPVITRDTRLRNFLNAVGIGGESF